MSLLELSRAEKRLRELITQMHQSINIRIEQNERDLNEKIMLLEERIRSLIAKKELEKTNVTHNPVFEAEESDDSV